MEKRTAKARSYEDLEVGSEDEDVTGGVPHIYPSTVPEVRIPRANPKVKYGTNPPPRP